jgi:glucan phosphorylase
VLLPEALEQWPVTPFERLLPRHPEIIHEINASFLDQVRLQALSDTERVTRLSLINDADGRHVRMAHLACVGSVFSGGDGELFRPLVETLLRQDPYLVLADFESYVNTQMRVDKIYADRDRWSRTSILNTACSWRFSSDRTPRILRRHLGRPAGANQLVRTRWCYVNGSLHLTVDRR